MTPLEVVTLAHAGLAAGFALLATGAVLVRPRRAAGVVAGPRAAPAPVVLLRATEQVDAAFAATLARDAAAYHGPLVRIVCVPGRAAAEAARAVTGVWIATSGVADDAAVNRKARHLAAGLALAEREGLFADGDVGGIVVHADADVELAGGELDALVAAVGTGAAFAAPAPFGGSAAVETVAQAIVCASPQAFAALWAVARITRSPPAIAGKLVAIHARALAAIGGYAALEPFIADDVALVDALFARGLPVFLAPSAARAHVRDRTWRTLLAQLTRWLRVAAAHRPGLLVTYPLLVAPAALSLSLAAACAATGHLASGLGAITVLIAARLLLAVALLTGPYRACCVRAIAASPFAMIVGDLFLTIAAAYALRPKPIAWAGRRYQVARGGRIRATSSVASGRVPLRHM